MWKVFFFGISFCVLHKVLTLLFGISLVLVIFDQNFMIGKFNFNFNVAKFYWKIEKFKKSLKIKKNWKIRQKIRKFQEENLKLRKIRKPRKSLENFNKKLYQILENSTKNLKFKNESYQYMIYTTFTLCLDKKPQQQKSNKFVIKQTDLYYKIKLKKQIRKISNKFSFNCKNSTKIAQNLSWNLSLFWWIKLSRISNILFLFIFIFWETGNKITFVVMD